MFVGLHAMLAMKTDIPELIISDQEGAEFMKAAQNVLRHYSVEATQLTLDWIAFAGCSIGIYAPRLVAIGVRRKTQGGGRGRQVPVERDGNVLRPTGAWQDGQDQVLDPDLGF